MISFKQFLSEESYEAELLRKYTKSDNSFLYADDIADNFKHLVRKYPYKGGRIYRGLNFSSPQEYIRFRRSIRDGYIKSSDISSWSPSQSTAASFAKSPQVFVPTAAVLAGYDSRERVNGFIGAILVIDAPAGVGIDVNASGAAVESEVIMPAGSYKLLDIIPEKKWKHIVSKLDANQEIRDAIAGKKGKIDFDMFRSLWRYKHELVTDETKELMVNSGVAKFLADLEINLEVGSEWLREGRFARGVKEYKAMFPDGTIEFSLVGKGWGMLGLLSDDEAVRHMSKETKALIKRRFVDVINRKTKMIANKKVYIKYQNSFARVTGLLGVSISDFKYLKANYAANYQRFNELLRDMNRGETYDIRELTSLLKDSMEGPFN